MIKEQIGKEFDLVVSIAQETEALKDLQKNMLNYAKKYNEDKLNNRMHIIVISLDLLIDDAKDRLKSAFGQ